MQNFKFVSNSLATFVSRKTNNTFFKKGKYYETSLFIGNFDLGTFRT